MALIYDSSHSGQEIDAAVDAVQTTIPSQLAQIGSEIDNLEAAMDGLGNQFPKEAKDKLIECFRKVAWSIPDGDGLVDELETILNSQGGAVRIIANYTQTQIVRPWFSLDSLKSDLIVSLVYGDGSIIETNSYTLSGTLTTGTSVITVANGGLSATFQVNVSDWQRIFKYSDGDLDKINGSTSLDNTGDYAGLYFFGYTTANRRRSFPLSYGVSTPIKNGQNNYEDYIPLRYPIPVPPDSTQVVVEITPNTQYFGLIAATYDKTTGLYAMILDSGWKLGTETFTFTAGEYDYITIGAKYNSAGTTYPVEPTELIITFN